MKGKMVESSNMHTRALRLLRRRRHSRPPQRPEQKNQIIIISSDSDESSSEEERVESKREVNIQKKIKEEYQSEEDQEETEEGEIPEEEEEETEYDEDSEEESEENEEESKENEEKSEEESEGNEEESEENEENQSEEESEGNEEESEENEENQSEEESEGNEEESEENQSEEDAKYENEEEEEEKYENEMSWDRKAMINESEGGGNGESVELFRVESSASSVKLGSSYNNQNDGHSNANIIDNFSRVGDDADSATSNPVKKEIDEKEEEKEASIILKAGSEKSKSRAEEIATNLVPTYEAPKMPETRRVEEGEKEASKKFKVGSGKRKFIDRAVHKSGAKKTTSILKPTYKACTVHETRRKEEAARDVKVDNVVMMDVDKKESSEEMEVNNELPSKDEITRNTHRGNEEVGTYKSLKVRKVKKDKMSQSEFLRLLSNIDRCDDDLDANKLDNGSPSLTTNSDEHIFFPLVFSFGDDAVKVVEKTEQELELDELWRDFDLALNALKIGVYNDDQELSEGLNEQTCELNEASACDKGMHKYIIDDQIGIKCMFCTYVQMDIKYILPSWDLNTGVGFGRKDKLIEENPSLFIEISKAEKECHISHCHFDGTVWDLIPGIKDSMFPHQIEAFEFMWNNLAGTIQVDELKKHVESDETGGCVISHAPGTGKTRLSIMFLKSYMKIFPDCRPVILAPPGLLQTWKNEFKKWRVDIEIYDLNDDRSLAFQENAMEHATLSPSGGTTAIRLGKLLSWSKHKSVILVSYNLLAQKESEFFSTFLLEKAGLIIFDEGHTPRNDRSTIWSELKNIKTSKRILLSGTPFQNNFKELYNTLHLVRPKFADKLSTRISKRSCSTKHAEKAKKKGRYVQKDDAKSKWDILTKNVNANDNDLKMSIDEVKSVIAPFVHVHGGKILDTLPGLRKCMLILNPLPLQNIVREKMNVMKYNCCFDEDHKNTLVAIHPSLVMDFLSEDEKLMLDIEMLEKVRLYPNEGAKTNFVIELTRLCEALNEKIIVFCQYLHPLELIKDQLIKIFGWSEGKEILKLFGKLLSKSRQTLIDDFNNDSSDARVLLASTKACSEGISLVGASRVVLLDILWNPSIEFQAISRAHRIGQKKFVYVYQLITSGMKESEKFGVQANKKKISDLVFAPTLDVNCVEASPSNLEELDTTKLIAEDKVLVEMTGHDQFKDVFQKIYFLSKETSAADVHKI